MHGCFIFVAEGGAPQQYYSSSATEATARVLDILEKALNFGHVGRRAFISNEMQAPSILLGTAMQLGNTGFVSPHLPTKKRKYLPMVVGMVDQYDTPPKSDDSCGVGSQSRLCHGIHASVRVRNELHGGAGARARADGTHGLRHSRHRISGEWSPA